MVQCLGGQRVGWAVKNLLLVRVVSRQSARQGPSEVGSAGVSVRMTQTPLRCAMYRSNSCSSLIKDRLLLEEVRLLPWIH